MKNLHNTTGAVRQAPSFRGKWLAGIATASALAGLIAMAPEVSAHGDGRGGPAASHHGHEDGKGAGAHPEKRMAQRVERVFTKVGASEEQKVRAREIVKAAAERMKALRPAEGKGDGPQEMLALLSADTIDRDLIEQHRLARHAQMDERSKLMTRTLADLAEVLTPEQRREAAKSLTRMGGGHGHHGMRHGDGPRAADS